MCQFAVEGEESEGRVFICFFQEEWVPGFLSSFVRGMKGSTTECEDFSCLLNYIFLWGLSTTEAF